MEDNVADALKMAAAVLLFVIALGIGISSFSQARQTIDTLIAYTDREYEYSYVEQNGGTERIVTIESIIPVIYRSFKENYKIYFYRDEAKTNKLPLYHKNIAGQNEVINFIDLQRSDIVAFGNDKQKEDFIMAILYGSNIHSDYGKTFSDINSYFNKNYKISLNSTGLYDTIKGSRFIEQIGEYFQEDEGTLDSETPDTNKTKKRVYTYILKN